MINCIGGEGRPLDPPTPQMNKNKPLRLGLVSLYSQVGKPIRLCLVQVYPRVDRSQFRNIEYLVVLEVKGNRCCHNLSVYKKTQVAHVNLLVVLDRKKCFNVYNTAVYEGEYQSSVLICDLPPQNET